MAVALILDFPGGTMDQYRQVVERMNLGGRLPPGGMYHAAGIHDGALRVTDVWEDFAHFEHFRDQKIIPYAADAGLSQPEVRVIEVHEEKKGSGKEPALVQVIHLPGLDAASFMEVDRKILQNAGPPEAITWHVNGPEGDGWCVVDAWDSKEARDRFLEERVKPSTEGSALTGPPEIQDLKVEATLASHAAVPV